jgi:hypothetical protein
MFSCEERTTQDLNCVQRIIIQSGDQFFAVCTTDRHSDSGLELNQSLS